MAKAIITGASSGLGEAIAKLLSSKGFEIVLIARSKEKIKSVKKSIISDGGQCISFEIDLGCDSSLELLSESISSFKDVSLLVNNAGCGFFGPIEEISIDSWDQQFNINVRASFLLSKMVLPCMKKNKTGSVIFINSVAGLQNFIYSSAYVASKFALRGFAGSLREELREYGIKVMSVFPGAINTPFWDNFENSFNRKEMLDLQECSQMIVENILSPGNLVVEDLLVRRIEGDF